MGPLTLRLLRRARRFTSDTSGLASIELALIIPFALLVAIGLVDYGVGVHRNMELANAARAGTQYAVIRKPIQGDTQEIEDAVNQAAPTKGAVHRTVDARLFCECPDGTEISCSTTYPGGEYRSAFVEVTVSEDYRTLLSYTIFENPIRLENRATVRLN